jgi:isocitrate dehydrogenase kinase/phosphatase
VAIVGIIAARYGDFRTRSDEITGGAAARFAARDWRGHQNDAAARLDAYPDMVTATVAEIVDRVGEAASQRRTWADAKPRFGELVSPWPDVEIAETFFNSITRRLLTTVGFDADVEFLESPAPVGSAEAPVVRYEVVTPIGDDIGGGLNGDVDGSLEAAIERSVTDPGLAGHWQNLRRDLRLAAAEIRRSVGRHGGSEPVSRIEMLASPFYRGQGAYLVGRLRAGDLVIPLAIAVHHTSRGLVIGAVLAEASDLSVLFSYTRSSFFVVTDRPAALVGYLGDLLPTRTQDELYTAIGHRKHGKTEFFRQFYRHITTTEDRFEHARGIRGMVMIVFTVPGYDVVFKVIRDRFPWPKQTTRRQIMAKYRLVTRHDRAGRLVDAHEFEQLRFERSRFNDDLLAEFADQATRSVTVDDDFVTLHHVYVERRLAPLDLYLREANPVKARTAVIDYGRAIKNLAAAGIFPGDMLLKNFGVTRNGRVVFYDYDEITPLVDCNFREMPESDRPDEEMSAEPWFGVGGADIFPEEFAGFLGIRGELREAFDYHHADLFGVRFWTRTQDRLRTGEVIEIFPYKRSRRLGASARRTVGPVD